MKTNSKLINVAKNAHLLLTMNLNKQCYVSIALSKAQILQLNLAKTQFGNLEDSKHAMMDLNNAKNVNNLFVWAAHFARAVRLFRAHCPPGALFPSLEKNMFLKNPSGSAKQTQGKINI